MEMLSLLENTHHRRSASSRPGEDRLHPDRLDRASVAPASLPELGMSEVSGRGIVTWKWPNRILGGTIAWLAHRWARSEGHPPRLAVIERLALSPKQVLLLVEADGMRLLISTSAEAPSTIFPLHGMPAPVQAGRPILRPGSRVTRPQAEGRISW